MALIFCDSFDHYDTTDMFKKWTQAPSGTCTIASGSGRNGTACLRTNTGASNNIRLTLGANLSTIIIGFAMQVRTATGTASGALILRLLDSGNNQVELRINENTQQLQLTRNGTVIATGTTGLTKNIFNYIELKVVFSNSGSYELRINGVTEFSGSADTTNTANNFIQTIQLGVESGTAGQSTHDYDDLYICDGTGSTNNDFLGDVRVEAILPNGNGNSSQFTGSDANSTDNYLLVDEVPANEDTDYVEDSSVGDKDTYTFGDLTPTTGSVYGVQVLTYGRKTDAGTRSVRHLSRLSGTEVDNGADLALTTSYVYQMSIFETDPGGGSWSLADVNSAEFGMKVAA